MKISVITPSYNSSATLERAIQSVLIQDYPDYEHIVIDGDSTDETRQILKNHAHLVWISEKDRGQVHALNKGFDLATGDIIVCLNADDYFLEGAFSTVIPYFEAGDNVVMGKVLVKSEKAGTIQDWTCDARADLASMLSHWERSAFCVNPVGYFYHRKVQETIGGFDEAYDDKHDLVFLLEIGLRFGIRKVDVYLGVFNHDMNTKTAKEQLLPSYWRQENFPFVGRIMQQVTPLEDQRRFYLAQERGYQLRRRWSAEEAIALGLVEKLLTQREIVFLPQNEAQADKQKDLFVDFDCLATARDWVIVILSCDREMSVPIQSALAALPEQVLPVQMYHLDNLDSSELQTRLPLGRPEDSVGLALHRSIAAFQDILKWKIITVVQDPVAAGIAKFMEEHHDVLEDPEALVAEVVASVERINTFFDRQFKHSLGIDIFDHPFDIEKGYCCLDVASSLEILICQYESLSENFPKAMQDFLGLQDMAISSAQGRCQKKFRKACSVVRDHNLLSPQFLETVYSSKAVKHFYSNQTIVSMVRQWISDTAQAVPEDGWLGTIYDVGLHTGQDTEFYLKKGFKVVAIDANPQLIAQAGQKFARQVQSGQLILINVAIAQDDGDDPLTFYIHPKNSEWSSCVKELAERDGCEAVPIEIDKRRLSSVVHNHGQPYFIKIDIEGHDQIALQSLYSDGIRPYYISVENGKDGMLDILQLMGLTKFKYVQQNNVSSCELPFPPGEGLYAVHNFEPGSSGPFGEETPGAWRSYAEVKQEIAAVWDLDSGEKNPEHRDEIHGWFDLHAKWTDQDNADSLHISQKSSDTGSIEDKVFFSCIDTPFKIAYLTIPKNACTSLRMSVASIKNPALQETNAIPPHTIHTNASHHFDRLVPKSAGKPPGYFSFTFVRNPVDRFLSFYRNKVLYNWDQNLDQYMRDREFYPQMPIEECLDRIAGLAPDEMNEHFAPQYLFVFQGDQPVVDFIGKLELLQQDWAALQQRIGLSVRVPRYNVSKDVPGEILSETSLEKLYDIYVMDFNMFDYQVKDE